MSAWLWGKVENLLCHITPPCKEVTQLLSSSLERPLPFWRRVQLRLHFIICVWCHRYADQLVLLRTLLHRFHSHVPENGAQLSPQAREQIAARLRTETRP